MFLFLSPNQADSVDLVTRLLYRIRFSSEQRPFDVVSLVYMLPLVRLALEMGGIGRSVREEADEQITLAVETLSFHADQCKTRLQHLDLLLTLSKSQVQGFLERKC